MSRAPVWNSLITLLVLATVISCSDQDAPQDGRAAEFSATDEAARPPEIKQEVQELFDIWVQSFQSQNAALLESTLTQRLSQMCKLDRMQPWIEEVGPLMPALEVLSVYVDPLNPNHTIAELNIGTYDVGRAIVPFAFVPSVRPHSSLFPVVWEDGKWRAALPAPTYFPVDDACPFQIPMNASSPESQAHSETEYTSRLKYPKIPGLDFGDRNFLSPRDTLGSFGSLGMPSSSSTGGKSRILEFSRTARTHLTSASLMNLYEERMVHPSWDVQGRGAGDHGAWLTWTVYDDEGDLWYGSLAITATGVNAQQIWLLLRTSDNLQWSFLD